MIDQGWRQSVFFVDDDDQLRQANVEALELAGLYARAFGDAPSALKALDPHFRGAIVSDVRMPGMDGLEFFERVRAIDAEIPVILISGHADVPLAVGALRNGAFDFLTKPFAVDHLVASVQKAFHNRELVLENRQLRANAKAAIESNSPLIGDSAIMVTLRDTIAQVAKADVDVLVEGETGTGKELVAVLLHRQGPRRVRPFVAVNCGALPEAHAEAELFGESGNRGNHRPTPGRIQSSDKGTLFLDEIDSMSATVQIKLLRVLEEREILPLGGDSPRSVDLRVVAASKRDLHSVMNSGEFRSDLYYRLNVVRLRVPPLRERRSDIPQLFAYFVSEAAEQIGLAKFSMSDSVRRHLAEHDWPGNVRELRNFAFTAVLNLPTDGLLDRTLETNATLSQRVEAFEASILRETLQSTRGDIRQVTESLGLPRKTLYDKLGRHGIDPSVYRTKQKNNL